MAQGIFFFFPLHNFISSPVEWHHLRERLENQIFLFGPIPVCNYWLSLSIFFLWNLSQVKRYSRGWLWIFVYFENLFLPATISLCWESRAVESAASRVAIYSGNSVKSPGGHMPPNLDVHFQFHMRVVGPILLLSCFFSFFLSWLETPWTLCPSLTAGYVRIVSFFSFFRALHWCNSFPPPYKNWHFDFFQLPLCCFDQDSASTSSHRFITLLRRLGIIWPLVKKKKALAYNPNVIVNIYSRPTWFLFF